LVCFFELTLLAREKNDVKELSRIAANTAKTFEQTTRDTAQASAPRYGGNFR
jgi:hypothetical protein